MKNSHNLLLTIIVVFLLTNCGGGGGKLFPPSVAYNPHNIVRLPLYDYYLGKKNRQEIPRTKATTADDFYADGIRFSRSTDILFNGERLKLAIPLRNWIGILNENNDTILRLKTPRYARQAVAVELKHPNQQSILAILITQQATSHSSTLYVLNSSFDIIYKEHHLQAYWLSKVSTKVGDKLLLSTEKAWNTPNGDLLTGGNWQYSFFGS